MSDSILSRAEILVLDDEPLFRRRLAAYLRKEGAEVTEATSLQEARQCLERLRFDEALIDINLPDGESFELLREHRFPATTGVVVMTAEDGVKRAVEAMRLGAGDYLAKPFAFEELPIVFARLRAARNQGRIQEHRLKDENDSAAAFFFGTGMDVLQERLNRILDADRRLGECLPPILITGETGSGKSTLARWIHSNGPRSAAPMVEVNCSTLPDQLAESELFGHERGAFTDARTARIGLFEAADGGTMFLDEVPSLSAAIQAKVLIAIEDRKIRRLGGNREMTVDARIIAASNQDLPGLVRTGAFREDLFHRLDLFRLELPPLRHRGEGILLLAEHLLRGLRKRYRRPNVTIGPPGQKALREYSWPGNVRELAHELERAMVLEQSDTLVFPHLHGTNDKPHASHPDPSDWLNPHWSLPESGFSIEAAMHRLIDVALAQCDGNVSAAARRLGVNRDYVRYRLKERDAKL